MKIIVFKKSKKKTKSRNKVMLRNWFVTELHEPNSESLHTVESSEESIKRKKKKLLQTLYTL